MNKYLGIVFFTYSFLFSQSDSQIIQGKKLMRKMGINQKQAIEIAKEKGYSDKQIQSVINKNKNLKAQGSLSNGFSQSDKINQPAEVKQQRKDTQITEKNANNLYNEDDVLKIDDDLVEGIQSNQKDDIPLATKSKYFGYDIFSRDPSLFQASSVGSIDPDYLIGPGDEVIVMLWGETQFREILVVDREGFVFIPEIGQVFVNGLDLQLLESKLFRVLSKSYASLNPVGRKPTTFLDISLGNLRPLRIQVLGEVAQPGAYVISPSSTLFTSLYYFNGPTIFGSLRDIVLIRKGEKIASIDFYDYLLTGKKPEDQKLQHDDVIFIPQRLKTISIQGAVKRPGIYELKNDETLSDLFEIGGGLKNTAYLDRAQIDRIVPFEERKNLDMDRMIIDINLSDFLKTKEKLFLYDGDDIEIFSIKDLRQNTVRLIGAVNRSGNYDIKDSLSLVELISKADGVVGDAYLKRVDITRTEQDLTETLIKIDLDKALRGELEHNIMLQSLDVVRVYSITEMVEKDYVTIVGQVNNPGNYTLQKNMSLYDLIFKAGGIIDEKNKKLMYMDRADLVRWSANSSEKELIVFNLDSVLNKNGKAQLMLKPDDLVRIYSKKEIEGETSNVNISGMVKRPGDYELFKHNMTVYDLLFKAGGLDDPEFSAKIFFDRADLIRLDEDRITSSIKPFNLKNAWGKRQMDPILNFCQGIKLESIQKMFLTLLNQLQ